MTKRLPNPDAHMNELYNIFAVFTIQHPSSPSPNHPHFLCCINNHNLCSKP